MRSKIKVWIVEVIKWEIPESIQTDKSFPIIAGKVAGNRYISTEESLNFLADNNNSTNKLDDFIKIVEEEAIEPSPATFLDKIKQVIQAITN